MALTVIFLFAIGFVGYVLGRAGVTAEDVKNVIRYTTSKKNEE